MPKLMPVHTLSSWVLLVCVCMNMFYVILMWYFEKMGWVCAVVIVACWWIFWLSPLSPCSCVLILSTYSRRLQGYQVQVQRWWRVLTGLRWPASMLNFCFPLLICIHKMYSSHLTLWFPIISLHLHIIFLPTLFLIPTPLVHSCSCSSTFTPVLFF